jgi:hypothetical protein
VVNRRCYARRFAYCLFQRDLSALRLVSDDVRGHGLRALAALSKYLGCYEDFRGLVKNYGLKWNGKKAEDLIIARLLKGVNGDEVYEWMREVKRLCPEYGGFVDFMAATGLRYEESVNSWNLIIQLARENALGKYYNERRQVLEHFRFKELFLRNSKKAFISFIAKRQVDAIALARELTVNVLLNRLKRRKIRQRFSDIRELHASVLTRHLSQPEIDFLHGRVSTSVFMRNYFNPAWISDLQTRTLKAANEILAKTS